MAVAAEHYAEQAPRNSVKPERLGRTRRVAVGLGKIFFGALLTQGPVSAVLVVGWTLRLMQRTAVKAWWRAGRGEKGVRFRDAARLDPTLAAWARTPNWILGEGGWHGVRTRVGNATGVRAKLGGLLRGLFGGVASNAAHGIAGLFNTFVLTLLPALLWHFGWVYGWHNSFYKGYEQHSIGVTMSLIGIALFLPVMLYVPLAQARQGVTGSWRAFYDFRVIRRVARERISGCVMIAGMYALLAFPLVVAKTVPYYFPQMDIPIDTMSDAELLQFVRRYFFWLGVAGFVAYVALRVLAARVYAGGVLAGLYRGTVTEEMLHARERDVLGHVGLLAQAGKDAQPPAWVRVSRATVGRAWTGAAVAGMLALWFVFVAEMYVTTFLNYHPGRDFLNQPLVQAPWFDYTPGHLAEGTAVAAPEAPPGLY